MCKGAVAAPRPLQALVYPILRRMSLPFCENSRKFLKLCTAVRKMQNETFEKGKNYSLSQNLTVLPAPSGREPLAGRYSLRSNRFKNTDGRVAAQGQLFVTASESKRYGVTAVI